MKELGQNSDNLRTMKEWELIGAPFKLLILQHWCERGESNPHGCPLDPKSFPGSHTRLRLPTKPNHFKNRALTRLATVGMRLHKVSYRTRTIANSDLRCRSANEALARLMASLTVRSNYFLHKSFFLPVRVLSVSLNHTDLSEGVREDEWAKGSLSEGNEESLPSEGG